MESEAILALYDRQQRIEIEYPDMRKDVLPEVVRFVRPGPGMSQIRYSWLDEGNADRVIQEQVDYFRPHDGPFTWKVYSHDPGRAGIRERLAAQGFVPDEGGPLMVLDLENAPVELLRPVTADVRRLTEREQLEDVIEVMKPVWGGNFDWMRGRMGGHMAIPGHLSIYVAYVEDKPACAGWTYFYGKSQFASLFGGSTIEAYRKRGLYTAVLAVRVQEAIQRGGRFMDIEASSMSQPIVSRHGFRVVCDVEDWEWRAVEEDKGTGRQGDKERRDGDG